MSITYLEAIREAQARALADDPRVFIYGQDIGKFGGAFKATKGLMAEFGPLRVMTTHLEYYSERQRQIQIEAIRHLHAEACAMSARVSLPEEKGGAFEVFPRPCGALLCGDMNFPASAPERAQILAPFAGGEPGFRDAWAVLHPGEPHAPTVGIRPVDFVKQPECFDFVFLTEGLAGRKRAGHLSSRKFARKAISSEIAFCIFGGAATAEGYRDRGP